MLNILSLLTYRSGNTDTSINTPNMIMLENHTPKGLYPLFLSLKLKKPISIINHN